MVIYFRKENKEGRIIMSDDKIIDFGQIKKEAEKTSVIDKLEKLINSSIEDIMTQKMSYIEFIKKMDQFQKENNLTPEEFKEIELGVLNRFGISESDIISAREYMPDLDRDMEEHITKELDKLMDDYSFLNQEKDTPKFDDFSDKKVHLSDNNTVDFENNKNPFEEKKSKVSNDECEEKERKNREMMANIRFNFFRKYKDMYTIKSMVFEIKNEKNNLKVQFDSGLVTIVSEKKVDFSDSNLNELIQDYRMAYGEKIRVMVCEASNIYDYI